VADEITYRQLILVAESYVANDKTLGYMLEVIKGLERDIQSKASQIRSSVQVLQRVLSGDEGYHLTRSPIYGEQAIQMERDQYALWEFANLLMVYLKNHHNEDLD